MALEGAEIGVIGGDRIAELRHRLFEVPQELLVHEWRRFPFLDPRLPAQLLPDNWSGAKAADLFHTRHADWHPAAQRHWERLTATGGHDHAL
jgi:DNA-binding transcriptional regulator PaaX